MPKNRVLSSLTSRETMKFLFLASHGLRTPLSAIRWGCGRLRKMRKDRTPEEHHVIDQIHHNARKLTTVLGSMLTLAKLEEEAYRMKEEAILLCELIQHSADTLEFEGEPQWDIRCPGELTVMADRALLETIVRDLLWLCAESTRPERATMIRAEASDGALDISFYAALELPFLNPGASGLEDELSTVIGGTPGLLLSLTGALAKFLDGTVELTRVDPLELKTLQEEGVETEEIRDDEYRITLRLPLSY